MKAIETIYKGYRFRSRLEARWAVFFDALGIEYRYEVERYGNDSHTYLPDFYLPATKTWVEVKGDREALRRDWARMSSLLDFGGVLPDFAHSSLTNRGLLLLGDVPEVSPEYCGVIAHPIIQHHKGLIRSFAVFLSDGLHVLDLGMTGQKVMDLRDEFDLEAGPSDGWLVETRLLVTPAASPRALDAYRAARSARFEHGETPGGRA